MIYLAAMAAFCLFNIQLELGWIRKELEKRNEREARKAPSLIESSNKDDFREFDT